MENLKHTTPFVVFLLAILLLSTVGHSAQQPFLKGETLTYDIKKFKIKVGEATLTFNGETEVAGSKALSITFTARGFKFFDEEQIYLDPETFYPLLIKRSLNILGKEEQIVEFYDGQKGRVRIVKTAKGETSQQIIENGQRFDNIYGFIYRHRQSGQFNKNEEIALHLPTSNVQLKLVKKEKFTTADQEFDAYYMQSVPKKYEVLFDSGPKKIPLKINGALGVGSMSMIFTQRRIGN